MHGVVVEFQPQYSMDFPPEVISPKSSVQHEILIVDLETNSQDTSVTFFIIF
jgi:hypothetical protein